ncbi:MAG: PEGA domain-containing protein [Deltaproteobacteria bacterium]|nr:PEGA domain-containing protein [Deltaproteobacteria bacterium]
MSGSSQSSAKKHGSARSRHQTIAVWNVRTLGIEESKSRRVRFELNKALGRLAGFKLISEEKINQYLKKKKVETGAALSKVAAALKVDWLITGTLGGLGEQVTLDLQLLDGRKAKLVRRAQISLPVPTQERRAALDEVLIRLLNPTKWVGQLALDVTVTGAQVHLDGQPVATTPLAKPLTGLVPGKHILRITKEGYAEFSKFVVVRYNQLARLKVDLTNAMVVGLLYERKRPEVPKPEAPKAKVPQVVTKPKPKNTFRTVMTWTFLGLGAGLTSTGIYFAVATKRKVIGSIFSASGGALLVGSLTLFLLGLGDGDSSEADNESGLSFGPAFGPGGLTFSLNGRF